MATPVVCAAVVAALYQDEDEGTSQASRQQATLARNLRDRSDPFNLPERQFKKLFRLSREAAKYVVDAVAPFFPAHVRVNRISVTASILCSINFLSSGSYQRSVGGNVLFPMSQPSVSRALKITTKAMASALRHWVRFPSTAAEKEQLKRGFERLGMPEVCGIVDGTHVAIVKPVQREDNYVNRKFYHSLNVQIVCDCNVRIIGLNPKYPGRTHDAFIWSNSLVREHMEKNNAEGDKRSFLLDTANTLRQDEKDVWAAVTLAEVSCGASEPRQPFQQNDRKPIVAAQLLYILSSLAPGDLRRLSALDRHSSS
ncbi:harbinger transposase derived 1 [Nesidiocoris tenuis]|uniref:Harbinger transposase derived 1 n=1 Tax=Nesidiocoris tenuis TaxID=355587 RepID=A0ABN7AJ13_9HEMI|nr:harbinger transposase derived 1 [Nesidiocoris tenuis]